MILYRLCEWLKTVLTYYDILTKLASSYQLCDWYKNKNYFPVFSYINLSIYSNKDCIISTLRFKFQNTSCLLFLLLAPSSLKMFARLECPR